ncbi:hypothetical protein CYMTET_31765 [Cymbomonas tetramitiformis]|uniref:PHD-type domain-containing protein n=1 Tax=Cymbomonas tetramitiformis TaxID=36881 RepID=A0AAE0KSV5_9CHLO|nr:hypothetical protein CYMTET_31765 [Cymbomonas tetramitiformis]
MDTVSTGCAFCPEAVPDEAHNLLGSGALGKLTGPFFDFDDDPVLVHTECAIWSPKVYEDRHTGKLQYVTEEIQRGRGIRCAHCKQRGATIGCHAPHCARSYHLICARVGGCQLVEKDYLLLCTIHRRKRTRAASEKETTVAHLPKALSDVLSRLELDVEDLREAKGASKHGALKDALGRIKAVRNAATSVLNLEVKVASDDETKWARHQKKRLAGERARITPVILGVHAHTGREAGLAGAEHGFGIVAGMQSHILKLKEMVLLPLAYPDLFSTTQGTPPRGVLLHGGPGTGKTLVGPPPAWLPSDALAKQRSSDIVAHASVGAGARPGGTYSWCLPWGEGRLTAEECARCSGTPVAFFARKGTDCLGARSPPLSLMCTCFP